MNRVGKDGIGWFQLDELEDLRAWEGYEFWSAQLEAKMDLLDEIESLRAGFQDEREGNRDVFPF